LCYDEVFVTLTRLGTLLSQAPRAAGCFIAIALIALLDWRTHEDYGIATLYFIPLCLSAIWLSRRLVIAVCLGCTILHEVATFNARTVFLRSALVFLGYSIACLALNEVLLSRRRAVELAHTVTAETALRRQREAYLKAVLDSSPIALLVLDSTGTVQMANHGAAKLLRLAPGAVGSLDMSRNIPVLRTFLEGSRLIPGASVTLETRAWRGNGEPFLARIWLSVCSSDQDTSVAAALVDVTEDVREIEMSGLRDFMNGSRIVLGAVSHEMRNLAAAITLVSKNLSRIQLQGGEKELANLASLSQALERLASGQLRSVDPRLPMKADIRRILDEIYSIAAPEFLGAGSNLQIQLDQDEIWVRGDHHGILLATLNVVNNAIREWQQHPRPEPYLISVTSVKGRILIRFGTGGARVTHPERLFQPFEEHASGTGLGLYVSRSLIRSFGGDMRYEPGPGEPAFVLDLAAAAQPSFSLANAG
jgi:two-component system, LuxR family, sensor kinase FixL